MRAIFGLAGILIVLGVIVWIMSHELTATQQDIKTGNALREEASQIAGQDPSTGGPASSSVELDTLTTGGKLSGILVVKVVPGGAFEKYFGVQRNDTIVAVVYSGNRMNIRDMNGDSEMAKAQVAETYQRHGSLIVARNGQEVTLPVAPTGGSAQKKDSVQQQLDAIKSMAQ